MSEVAEPVPAGMLVQEVMLKTSLSKASVYREFMIQDGRVSQEQFAAWEARRLEKAAKKFKVSGPALTESWQKMLLKLDDKYRVKSTLENAAAVLQHDPVWSGVLATNAFSGELMLMTQPPNAIAAPEFTGPFPRAMTDQDLTRIRHWFATSQYAMEVRADTMMEFAEMICSNGSYHPVEEFLNGLVWDGVPRLDTWLKDYLGARYDMYSQRAGRYFLISAAARIRFPGCQADHVLVLEGPQGIGKSTASRVLATDPAWYLSGVRDLGNKETAMQLRGKWIVEFPELSAMKRSEVEAVKEFFTTHTDKYVPKFKNIEVQSKRSCVFVATVNHSQYLSDASGNRRFWPILCSEIDVDGLRSAMPQLWAEADHYVRQREVCLDEACRHGDTGCSEHRWWPSSDEQENYFDGPQGRRMVDDAWKPAVIGYMLECFTKGKRPTTADVVMGALQIAPGDITDNIQTRMVRLLKSMKYRLEDKMPKESFERVSVWSMESWQFREEDDAGKKPVQEKKYDVPVLRQSNLSEVPRPHDADVASVPEGDGSGD